MNLQSLTRLSAGSNKIQAGVDEIADAAKLVYRKKTGKGKGLDAIESDIRKSLESSYKSTGAKITDSVDRRLNSYMKQRMGYMRNSFKKLDNPKTDTSDERANGIGVMETKSAQDFGKTLGWSNSGKKVLKVWDPKGDCCELCDDNADEGPIEIDDIFPSGDYCTPAHVGCDCETTYVADEDDDLAAGASGWIGFDFDGTLAKSLKHYSPYQAGEPIRKMVNRCKAYIRMGKWVKIFTARASDPVAVKTVERWCKKYLGKKLAVTNVKDSKCMKIFDDKAVAIKENTGESIKASELKLREYQLRTFRVDKIREAAQARKEHKAAELYWRTQKLKTRTGYLMALQAEAENVISILQAQGISCSVIGSVDKQTAGKGSDIDILVAEEFSFGKITATLQAQGYTHTGFAKHGGRTFENKQTGQVLDFWVGEKR